MPELTENASKFIAMCENFVAAENDDLSSIMENYDEYTKAKGKGKVDASVNYAFAGAILQKIAQIEHDPKSTSSNTKPVDNNIQSAIEALVKVLGIDTEDLDTKVSSIQKWISKTNAIPIIPEKLKIQLLIDPRFYESSEAKVRAIENIVATTNNFLSFDINKIDEAIVLYQKELDSIETLKSDSVMSIQIKPDYVAKLEGDLQANFNIYSLNVEKEAARKEKEEAIGQETAVRKEAVENPQEKELADILAKMKTDRGVAEQAETAGKKTAEAGTETSTIGADTAHPTAITPKPAAAPWWKAISVSVKCDDTMDIFNKLLPTTSSEDQPSKTSALTAALTKVCKKGENLESAWKESGKYSNVEFKDPKHTIVDASICKTEFNATLVKDDGTSKEAKVTLTRTAEPDGKTTWTFESVKPISREMGFQLIAEQSLQLRKEEKKICEERVEKIQGMSNDDHQKLSPENKIALEKELLDLKAKLKEFQPDVIAISVSSKGEVKIQNLCGMDFQASDEQKAAIEAYLKAGFTQVQYTDDKGQVANFTKEAYTKSLESSTASSVTENPAPQTERNGPGPK